MELKNSRLTESHRKVKTSKSPSPWSTGCFIPVRYMVGVFLMFGYANVYALRVNLSVAIVVMVENHTVFKDNREIQVLLLLCVSWGVYPCTERTLYRFVCELASNSSKKRCDTFNLSPFFLSLRTSLLAGYNSPPFHNRQQKNNDYVILL